MPGGVFLLQPDTVTPVSPASPLNAVLGPGSASICAVGSAPYLANQTPVAASSGNVANAVATATLPAVAGKTNFLSGFEITNG